MVGGGFFDILARLEGRSLQFQWLDSRWEVKTDSKQRDTGRTGNY